MDEPIIVLIDIESRVVRLFGKCNKIIPFSMAFVLPSLLSGQEVLYISDVQRVAGEDVVNLLTQVITEDDLPTENLYIRSKSEGYVRIPELKITFSGSKDAKLIEKIGWDLFERSGTLRNLILQDKVEILTETEAKALRKRLDPRSKEKAERELILDKSIDDFFESQDIFGFGEEEDGIKSKGDLVSEDEGEKILTENEQIMRQYGMNWGKDRQKKEDQQNG